MSAYFRQYYLQSFINAVNSRPGNLELEVRLQGADHSEGLDFKQFYRVKEYLYEKFGLPTSIENSIDTKKDGKRRTVIQLEDSYELKTIQKREFFFKPMYKQGDKNELDIKVSLSTEEDIESIDEIIDFDIERVKDRESWLDTVNQFRYDITRVAETKRGETTRQKYEVEIEMINPVLATRHRPMTEMEQDSFQSSFLRLGDKVLDLKRVMQDTDLPYTNTTRNALTDFIHKGVNAFKYTTQRVVPGRVIDFGVRARNIKKRDMVYKGLLNSPPGTTYSVTCKAEGLRKFLVIHRSGLWLVYTNEFCKIARFEDLPVGWQRFENTILDGEDIPVEHRLAYKNAKHYFLPFDTVMFAGRDVTKEPLKKRLEYASTIRSMGVIQIQNKTSLIMEEKPFYYFETSEEFYSSIKKVFNFIKNGAQYKTDGLMFTPVNTEYNPQTDGKPSLTKTPSICKWKPFEELTIDLSYNFGVKRYLSTSRGEEFRGNRKYSFDPEIQVDWFHSIFKDYLKNGTIIEFEPKLNPDGLVILVPRRVRLDKATANAARTAEDVWEDINEPIKEETLFGKTMVLQRQYHNNIKTRILSNNIPADSHLVDIGSGSGGDLGKWGKFGKVLAIEPFDEQLIEFRNRLEQNESVKDKVNILQAGGQESSKILKAVAETFGEELGDSPMYISMMLSLSFFWGEEKMLRGLLETILGIKSLVKEKNPMQEVKFIFFTIEGSRTLKLFKKYNNRIDFPGVQMLYKPDTEKVFINFPESITIKGTQEEYIVKLKELPALLDATVEYEREASGNKELLSVYEKEFSSMYVEGSYILN